jgi:hypothetical protein
MGSIFGKLLTAYALYTLNGAGLIVIFLAGSCWYVQGNYGWIALGVYLVVWWILFECLIRAIANWINKNSPYYGNKPFEPEVREKKEKVRATRHGY